MSSRVERKPRQRDPESQVFCLVLLAVIAVTALIAWPFAMWLGWGVWVFWGGLAIWPAIPAFFLSFEGLIGSRDE